MKKTCNGITLSGARCKRTVTNNNYCHQHLLFRQERPEHCIVCYESLRDESGCLQCGHWIHTSCIVKSGKEECPICRFKLNLDDECKEKIRELAKLRREEELEEEEAELRAQGVQFAGFMNPILYNIVHDIILETLYETNDIMHGDILIDILIDEVDSEEN